jgi:tRNA nucleotidyltransferase/poly(A) polymerase
MNRFCQPPDLPVAAPLPDRQRRFALQVVEKLRAAGFQAYWAGGCVRDKLMGRVPKDYDVATDATPRQIDRVFGDRRTLAIGAAFGVITVVGPRAAGQVEVTTFRQDAAYSDGRHPDSVTFCSAAEDASRRDFTINGLFFDPVEGRVIDYVGGQEDLQRRVIRAIGDPRERFEEDKLRMLRAVRFSATMEFPIESATLEAVRSMAAEIDVVSPERIAVEMQRMLVDRRRVDAVRLLLESGLAPWVLPEVVGRGDEHERRLEQGLDVAAELAGPSFPLALAAVLCRLVDAAGARAVGRRWRLSNEQTGRTAWLVEHQAALRGARTMRWSALQKILVQDVAEDLLDLHAAAAAAGQAEAADGEYCRRMMQQPSEQLDPPPLLTGDDLLAHGVPRGPIYRVLLARVRDAQLDGQIHDKQEALALADRILAEPKTPNPEK